MAATSPMVCPDDTGICEIQIPMMMIQVLKKRRSIRKTRIAMSRLLRGLQHHFAQSAEMSVSESRTAHGEGMGRKGVSM
jgi:hypothetical protein